MANTPDHTATAIKAFDQSLDQLRGLIREFPAEALWKRPLPGLASLGNLVVHTAGSMQDWFRNGADSQGWVRDREGEFNRDGGLSAEDLLALLDEARKNCDSVMRSIGPSNWDDRRQFRGFDITLGEILHRQASHVAYHAGQGAFLRRLVAGLSPKT